MHNVVNKRAIIDEYLFGGISYRRLSKKVYYSRATLHEWVWDFTGIAIIARGTENAVILSAMELKQSEELPKEILALTKAACTGKVAQ
jgi:transposase